MTAKITKMILQFTSFGWRNVWNHENRFRYRETKKQFTSSKLRCIIFFLIYQLSTVFDIVWIRYGIHGLRWQWFLQSFALDLQVELAARRRSPAWLFFWLPTRAPSWLAVKSSSMVDGQMSIAIECMRYGWTYVEIRGDKCGDEKMNPWDKLRLGLTNMHGN